MLNREAEQLHAGDPVLIREADGTGFTPATVIAVLHEVGPYGNATNVRARLPDGTVAHRLPRYIRRRAS